MLIVYFYFRQIKVKKTNELNFPSQVLKSLGLIWNIPLILPIFSQIIRQNFPSKNPESFKIPVTNFEVSISRKNPSKLILFTFSKLHKWTRFISFQSSKWTFNFPSKSSYINKNPSKIPVKYKANRILCSFPIFFPKVLPSKIKILKSTKFSSWQSSKTFETYRNN